MNNFGHKLREFRVAAGVSQAELARRVGTAPPNVCDWEAGRVVPSVDRAGELLHALGGELQIAALASKNHAKKSTSTDGVGHVKPRKNKRLT